MDAVRLEHYRQRLESLAAELQQTLATSAYTATPVSPDSAIGRLTRMDAMQSQQMALALRERQRVQLQRVQQALRFIAEGRYGLCAKCGEDVSERRLEVAPESVLFLGCAK